jgi:DNA-binding SARP family transcriptional activator
VVHQGGRLLIFWRMSNPSQARKNLVSDIHRIKTIYIHLIYAI